MLSFASTPMLLSSAAMLLLSTVPSTTALPSQLSSRQSCSDLPCRVPPPACLATCILESNICEACVGGGAWQSGVAGCLTSTCAPKDQSYASAYLGEICPDGGYLNGTTQEFNHLPKTTCSAPSY